MAGAQLTAEHAAMLATTIGSSDGGMSFGCTRLLAAEKGLTTLPGAALARLVHLTYVDVSCNQLSSLDGLAALPGLSTLLASLNRCTSVRAASALRADACS